MKINWWKLSARIMQGVLLAIIVVMVTILLYMFDSAPQQVTLHEVGIVLFGALTATGSVVLIGMIETTI